MKKLLLLLFIPLISIGQEVKLTALRLSNNFSKPNRVLKTTISDKSFFVDINFIVHPTYEILSFDSKELIINSESSTYRLSFQANQNFKLSEEPAYHCPDFGIKQNTSSILLSIEKKDKIKKFKTQFTIEEI